MYMYIHICKYTHCIYIVYRHDNVHVLSFFLQIMFGWRKACEELTKRLDRELKFFYHTSTHQRFYEGERPDFSLPASRPRCETRAPRRELLSRNVGGCAVLAQRGATSIRTQFHNVPVHLPPPPSMPTHAADHAYQ